MFFVKGASSRNVTSVTGKESWAGEGDGEGMRVDMIGWKKKVAIQKILY